MTSRRARLVYGSKGKFQNTHYLALLVARNETHEKVYAERLERFYAALKEQEPQTKRADS